MQQNVDDTLRCLYIPAGNSGRRTRIYHCAFRRDQPDWAHQPGGGGDIFAQQTAKDVEAR